VQAVLGRVAPMTKVYGSRDAAASQTLADQAMERYADGDEGAFGTLYDALAPRLYRYVLRRTHSVHLAEDVVQQTFFQMHSARGSFVRGAAVLAWSYAIARRLVIDASRRGGRERLRAEGPGVEERSTELAADEALALKEEERAARRAFDLLPPALREAFQLVKLEGLSVAETAAVLGITPGMVKIRTHRAKLALQRHLAGTAPEGEGSPAGPAPPAPEEAEVDATPIERGMTS